MIRKSRYDFRQGHTYFSSVCCPHQFRANPTFYICTTGTGSSELESTVECSVYFLRRRLTLGKNNRLYSYGCYQKKNFAVLEAVYLVAQKTADTNTTQNSRRADTSLSVSR